MTNELARIQGSVIPTTDEWSTIHSMAAALLPTGFLPNTIKTPEQATAIILKGRELQIPPMYALSNVVIIQGKPACSAELLQALIYRDHGDDALRFTESTNDACTIEYRRRSWKKPERYTFTIDDAKRANLNSATWKQYPAAMLRARCLSAVARMAFADSIGGMHTSEELGASVTVVDGVVELDTRSVIDVTPHTPTTRQDAPHATIGVPEESDTISERAVEAITAVATRRELKPDDVLAVIDWHGFEVERLEELTVEQGRDLYRFLDKAPDADLHEAVHVGTVALQESIADQAFRESITIDGVVEHDNITEQHDNTDIVEAFNRSMAEQETRTINPMFT